MKRLPLIFTAFLLHSCTQQELLASDPTITVLQSDQQLTILGTAPLTEATAKRLLGAIGPTNTIYYWQVTAATNGTSSIPARSIRMRMVIENIGTETLWVSNIDPATSTNGFPILANTAYNTTYTGALYFASASGATIVYAAESWTQ